MALHTFHAGPRLVAPRTSRIRPYGQFLLGTALDLDGALKKKFVFD
jgi:hypothetical protein